MSRRIKLTRESENRIINAPTNFTELSSKILTLFNIQSNSSFKLYYQDPEGDLIAVTNQEDYELAMSQTHGQLRFYIGENAENVTKSIINKPILPKETDEPRKFDMVESNYIVEPLAKKPEPMKIDVEKPELIKPKIQESNVDIYACFACNGTKVNKSGKKPCKICSGTGKIPESYLAKIRDSVRHELISECDSQVFIAASAIAENQKKLIKPPQPDIIKEKSPAKSESTTVYSINPGKKDKLPPLAKTMSETLKDGYKVLPNSSFSKMFVIKNTGKAPWPKDTRFVQVSGDQVNAVASPVGEVPPGEIISITVNITAPNKEGRYVPNFKLICGENEKFGEQPWVDFIVTNNAEEVKNQ